MVVSMWHLHLSLHHSSNCIWASAKRWYEDIYMWPPVASQIYDLQRRALGCLEGYWGPWGAIPTKKMISIESVAGFDRDDYDTWLVFMFYIMFLLLSSLSSSKLPHVRYIDCWFSKILIVNPPQSFGLSRKERLRQRQHRIFVSLLWSVAR